MAFRISGLPAEPFAHLYGLDDAALAAHGARRMIADKAPGYPCRITLEDAAPGEPLLLVHYTHLDGDTPYRGHGAVFVREYAAGQRVLEDSVPLQLSRRILSVRGYDAGGWMLRGEVLEGSALESAIPAWFEDADIAYLHVHNAGRGCYAARVDRA